MPFAREEQGGQTCNIVDTRSRSSQGQQSSRLFTLSIVIVAGKECCSSSSDTQVLCVFVLLTSFDLTKFQSI